VSSADNIMLTEFFFSGLISELSDVELLSILTLFNTQSKAPGNVPECAKMYSDKFKKTVEFVIAESEKLILLEGEFGIVSETDIKNRINLKFYEAVYEWADGSSFNDIINTCGIEEGIVVKMIMTVDRIRQSLHAMAKVVGDNSLA
jgi:antiviral helicase SKI2